MAYLILAYDHPGKDTARELVREAHRAHLAKEGKRLLGSGALLDEDDGSIIGGFSVLDTDIRSEAVAFEADDPYAKAGIRAQVTIVKWRPRWWLGEFDPDGHRPSKD